jgi:hypothetical protein
MNPSNQTPPLGQPSTPEEDIALQAIESLNVEGSEDTAEPSPVVSDTPELPKSNNDEPAPIVRNPISDIKTAPPVIEGAPEAAPAPAPAQSAADTSLAAANAEPAPATTAFQPFAQQKPAHSPLKIALIVVLILVVIGGGAYVGWQYFL